MSNPDHPAEALDLAAIRAYLEHVQQNVDGCKARPGQACWTCRSLAEVIRHGLMAVREADAQAERLARAEEKHEQLKRLYEQCAAQRKDWHTTARQAQAELAAARSDAQRAWDQTADTTARLDKVIFELAEALASAAEQRGRAERLRTVLVWMLGSHDDFCASCRDARAALAPSEPAS